MPLELLGTSRRGSYSRAKEERERNKKSGANLFLWTILITILIALNAGVWTFSLMVFGYPEKPFNYHLLTKLKKLDEIKSFSTYAVPKGKFHNPQQIYEAYYAHTPQQLKTVNALLLRQYIENYRDVPSVVYVRGTFRVYQAKKLTEDDLFPSGLVVRGVYQEYPQVVVEYVMPAEDVPDEHFKIGDDLSIDTDGSSVFASLLHVEKLPDYKICFTLVPLVYGSSYPLGEGRVVKLSPPKVLNIDGSLPITEEAIGELPPEAVADTP